MAPYGVNFPPKILENLWIANRTPSFWLVSPQGQVLACFLILNFWKVPILISKGNGNFDKMFRLNSSLFFRFGASIQSFTEANWTGPLHIADSVVCPSPSVCTKVGMVTQLARTIHPKGDPKGVFKVKRSMPFVFTKKTNLNSLEVTSFNLLQTIVAWHIASVQTWRWEPELLKNS